MKKILIAFLFVMSTLTYGQLSKIPMGVGTKLNQAFPIINLAIDAINDAVPITDYLNQSIVLDSIPALNSFPTSGNIFINLSDNKLYYKSNGTWRTPSGTVSDTTGISSTLVNGLTAGWKLNESSGNVIDVLGSNTGYHSGVTYGDGATYAGAGSTSFTSSINPTTSFSVGFMAKTSNTAANTPILTNQNYAVGWEGYNLQIEPDGNLGVYFGTNTTTGLSYSDNPISPTLLNNDAWHVVVMTWDGTTVYTYVDGVKSSGTAYSTQIVYDAGCQMRLGYDATNDVYATGSIKSVYVWADRALTETEALEFSSLEAVGTTYPWGSGIATIEDGYYVKPTGNDAFDGLSIANAWATLTYAEDQLVAGDILYVMSGTYNEKLIVYGVNGTSVNPIQIKAYPGQHPIIDGTGLTFTEGSGLVMIWPDYIQLSGFEVRNANIDGTNGVGGTGIYGIGSHSLVSNCNVHDCWQIGVCVSGDYSIVEYCNLYNTAMSNSDGVYQTNEVWSGGMTARQDAVDGITDYPILRRNTIHSSWGEGLDIAFTDHAIMEDNIVYDNYSVGLYIRNSQNAIVRRNLVYNTDDIGDGSNVGLGYWNEGADAFVNQDNTIVNNIVYQTKRNFYADDDLINTSVTNNTFVNSRSITCVQISDRVHSGSIFKDNLVVQEDALACITFDPDAGVTFSNNLYNKSHDTDAVGTGDVTGDPLLLKSGSYSTTYFSLQTGSPAVNTGANTGVTTDYLGNGRVGSYDIGSLEKQ